MSAFHQTAYRTIERGIRQYPSGLFIAVITRWHPKGSISHLRCGLRSIGQAREARAELERLHPRRKQGRKPGAQGQRSKIKTQS